MEQSGPFGESGLGLRVRGTRFIDDAGRQVLLHGVNMVCKEESRHWVGGWSDEDFARLRRWGLNVIRLGMNWNAPGPEPGVYDDEYVEGRRRFGGRMRMACCSWRRIISPTWVPAA
ncbi:hypothetical protein L5D93_06575 [Paenibacillus thiaminolyticus]|nr:hypothetical protein [Paenibacillus thiaminolyticus]